MSGDVKVWLLPAGAEVLDVDGRQAFYATEDGSGSAVDLGDLVKSVTIEVGDTHRPNG